MSVIVTGYSLPKHSTDWIWEVTLIEVVFSLESVFLGYTNYKIALSSIIFFSAREGAEFNKSCNLIGSWSGRNFFIRTATAGGFRRVDLFS